MNTNQKSPSKSKPMTSLLKDTSTRKSSTEEDALMDVVISFEKDNYSISAALYHITYDVVHAVSKKTQGIKYKVSKTEKEKSFVKDVTYVLKEITTEELRGLWDNKTPSLVIKANGRLYHTTVTRHLTLNKRKMPRKHLCGDCHTYCKKVLDGSTHIEDYDFIEFGYELFGTDKNVLVVYNCKRNST